MISGIARSDQANFEVLGHHVAGIGLVNPRIETFSCKTLVRQRFELTRKPFIWHLKRLFYSHRPIVLISLTYSCKLGSEAPRPSETTLLIKSEFSELFCVTRI